MKIEKMVKNLMIQDLRGFAKPLDVIGLFDFELDENYEVTECSVCSYKDSKYFDFLFKKNKIEYSGTRDLCKLYQIYVQKVLSNLLGE